ncbi:MAG: hypothetical protein JXQ76_06355 [Campylobacterales bacterium]|nr:hypothetical protein [Campylobacterales bacterium]
MMMKNIVVLSLLSSAIYADAIEQNFVNDIAKTALMGSQKSFESGSHDLKANEEMWTLFAAFRYNFDSTNDWNFFVNAAGGVAEYKTGNPLVGNLGDCAKLEAVNIELGGGVRYKINNEMHIALGAGVLYSQIDPTFSYGNALTLPNRTRIDALYNGGDKLDSYTYQANIKYDYETNVNGYEPYVTAFLGYFSTDVDGLDATSDSTLAHIKAGVYSPELVKIFNLPFKVEAYAQETFLMGDIKENMDTSNITQIGMAFHLYTNTLIKYVDNVYFDVNYVTGDNIEGFHVGVSAKF